MLQSGHRATSDQLAASCYTAEPASLFGALSLARALLFCFVKVGTYSADAKRQVGFNVQPPADLAAA